MVTDRRPAVYGNSHDHRHKINLKLRIPKSSTIKFFPAPDFFFEGIVLLTIGNFSNSMWNACVEWHLCCKGIRIIMMEDKIREFRGRYLWKILLIYVFKLFCSINFENFLIRNYLLNYCRQEPFENYWMTSIWQYINYTCEIIIIYFTRLLLSELLHLVFIFFYIIWLFFYLSIATYYLKIKTMNLYNQFIIFIYFLYIYIFQSIYIFLIWNFTIFIYR